MNLKNMYLSVAASIILLTAPQKTQASDQQDWTEWSGKEIHNVIESNILASYSPEGFKDSDDLRGLQNQLDVLAQKNRAIETLEVKSPLALKQKEILDRHSTAIKDEMQAFKRQAGIYHKLSNFALTMHKLTKSIDFCPSYTAALWIEDQENPAQGHHVMSQWKLTKAEIFLRAVNAPPYLRVKSSDSLSNLAQIAPDVIRREVSFANYTDEEIAIYNQNRQALLNFQDRFLKEFDQTISLLFNQKSYVKANLKAAQKAFKKLDQRVLAFEIDEVAIKKLEMQAITLGCQILDCNQGIALDRQAIFMLAAQDPSTIPASDLLTKSFKSKFTTYTSSDLLRIIKARAEEASAEEMNANIRLAEEAKPKFKKQLKEVKKIIKDKVDRSNAESAELLASHQAAEKKLERLEIENMVIKALKQKVLELYEILASNPHSLS